MKGHKTIITPELEEQVIRCYVKKGMSLATMANLGICDELSSAKILLGHNLMRKPGMINFGKSAKIAKDSPPH